VSLINVGEQDLDDLDEWMAEEDEPIEVDYEACDLENPEGCESCQ
jgi:hypothetical protein